jgi:hypothetical protein
MIERVSTINNHLAGLFVLSTIESRAGYGLQKVGSIAIIDPTPLKGRPPFFLPSILSIVRAYLLVLFSTFPFPSPRS